MTKVKVVGNQWIDYPVKLLELLDELKRCGFDGYVEEGEYDVKLTLQKRDKMIIDDSTINYIRLDDDLI